ncbi:MAG: 4-amino-4-deoxy-L-arabinose transferase [Symploca sp. SIO1B1]|nr:4-amino-4-deoxy-L-arabinose transferase [Symploca sp. SIO1B1]
MQTVKKWLADRANQSVLWLLLGGLLFRSIIAFCLYPGIDETYYYLYTLHLDWSYFDHPVLVALTTGFGPWVTGVVSQFTLRLATLILYTGSLFLLYLTGAQLFGDQAARLTLAIATIIPIFQVGFGVLSLPDSPLIFFWSVSLYLAAYEFFGRDTNVGAKHLGDNLSVKPKIDNPNASPSGSWQVSYQPSYRLAILSVLVGLACLGKYHGFILGLGLVGFCLTSPPHRCALRSPWAWLGFGLFLLTLFPLWFWNMQHDWVSFRFQLSLRFQPGSEETKSSYDLLGLAVAFLAGIGYLFPTMGFPLWWVSWQSLWEVGRGRDAETRGRGDAETGIRDVSNIPTTTSTFDLQPSTFLIRDLTAKQLLILWVSLPLTIGFTLLGGAQPILPTWSMPGFWGLTLLLGYKAVGWQQQSRLWVRRWLRGTGLFLGSCILLVLLHVTTGTLQKSGQYALFGGFLPVKDDPSTELIDIMQLRRGFQESPMLNQALQDSGFVFTNGFYLGGMVGMALSPITTTPITCFGEDVRGFAFWSEPEEWLGKEGLYVTIERFHDLFELTDSYRPYFSSFQEIATVPIRRGGAVTEVFHVYQTGKMLKPYPSSIPGKF